MLIRKETSKKQMEQKRNMDFVGIFNMPLPFRATVGH